MGMESGSDRVLKLIQKGVRSDQLVEGGKGRWLQACPCACT